MSSESSSYAEIWKIFSRAREFSDLSALDLLAALAALIFLRWADFQEAELEAIAAFDETDYAPVLSAGLHWRTWHEFFGEDLPFFLNEQLLPALERLSNSRHSRLATYLHRMAPVVKKTADLPTRVLGSLLDWLAAQPFETPADRKAIRKVFDRLLETIHDKHTDRWRTPEAVSRLMVALAGPNGGERVYDPCFGSAGLLTAACEHAGASARHHFYRIPGPPLDIFGVELDRATYLMGLTRLILTGIDDPRLELGNSLERPVSDNMQQDGFDVVLANLPVGKCAEAVGLGHFPVKTSDVAGLFIQHVLSHLRPEGRAVVVVPQGFLFRSGPEQRLRRYLIEQHLVEAVIALPRISFAPYTSIRSGLLVLGRNGPTRQIRMADAESLFSKGSGDQAVMLHENRTAEFIRCLRSPEPEPYGWDMDVTSLARVAWDFTPKRRDRSELDRILASLKDKVEISPLEKLCHIMAGRSGKALNIHENKAVAAHKIPMPTSSAYSDRPENEERMPYVRINDIQHGWVNKVSAWITSQGGEHKDSRRKLKSGDILVSKSGMIGKAGMVRNGGIGGIASSSLVVLRPDSSRLDPHFLLACLKSNDVCDWLNDQSRGTTIRYLTLRAFRELNLPVPPIQIQQRVVEQCRDGNTDAISFLVQLLTRGENDPVTEWLDGALRVMGAQTGLDHEDADVTILMHPKFFGENFTALHNQLVHRESDQNPLTAWIIALHPAVDVLRSTREVPPGPAYYSLLQQAEKALRKAERCLTGYMPAETRARELTRAVLECIEKAGKRLSSDVSLSISSDVSALTSGSTVSVDVMFRNSGPLPLREVQASTTPEWGEGRIGYLPEQGKKSLTFSGITPKHAGVFSLRFSWSVLAFDGRLINGDSEIAFNLVAPQPVEGIDVPGHGGSPYVCGDPVRPERKDVFFGREELLNQIRRQIIQTGNVVLLEGNRRAGKSSILWHLAGTNAIPGWLGVYCSLQGAEGSRHGLGVPTVEVFREMAKSMAQAIQTMGHDTPLPGGAFLRKDEKIGIAKACRKGIGDETPFSDFREYVETVLEWMDKYDLGLLLMLDEFDKVQEGIDSGVTSPQVPENIRFLVQTYPRFSAILTGSRRLKRLREEYWSALYGIGTRFGVSSLPEKDARRLIVEPVRNRLAYSTDAVDQTIYLTAGQPYLLQCLCNRIFDMAARIKVRSVSLDFVNQAGDALVEDNEHFASLWDYAETDRRRFILMLCHRAASGPDPLQLGVLQEYLLNHGVEVGDESLMSDLEFLRELELVALTGSVTGGCYSLAIPLMGIWIERQQDLAVLLNRARSEMED